MPATRNRRLHRAAALVPLAVVSAAWTITAAGVGGPIATVAQQRPVATPTLPDGTSVPAQAIEAPASVTADQGSLAEPGDATQILSTATTSGIPSAALAAYQRAETVIDAADTTCQLPWQLVAAIGRIESNHARTGGNTLTDAGLATPGIYGPALDGTGGTSLISDTDAGAYDNDTVYDHAVGPMQFIPSTWSVVGVDADGDGDRNPQDINDAALGTAVYLCSGTDDLSTPAGQQAAVFRYNHSQSYVDLVLSVMAAYTAGDFTTIPNSAVAAGYLAPLPAPATPEAEKIVGKKRGKAKPTPVATSTPTATPTTLPPPTTEPTPVAPSSTGASNGTGAGNGGGNGAGGVPSGAPTISLPPLPSTSITPLDQILTQTQAVLQCTLEGLVDNPLDGSDKFDQCVKDYTTGG